MTWDLENIYIGSLRETAWNINSKNYVYISAEKW